jgi:hypothetical protein
LFFSYFSRRILPVIPTGVYKEGNPYFFYHNTGGCYDPKKLRDNTLSLNNHNKKEEKHDTTGLKQYQELYQMN